MGRRDRLEQTVWLREGAGKYAQVKWVPHTPQCGGKWWGRRARTAGQEATPQESAAVVKPATTGWDASELDPLLEPNRPEVTSAIDLGGDTPDETSSESSQSAGASTEVSEPGWGVVAGQKVAVSDSVLKSAKFGGKGAGRIIKSWRQQCRRCYRATLLDSPNKLCRTAYFFGPRINFVPN